MRRPATLVAVLLVLAGCDTGTTEGSDTSQPTTTVDGQTVPTDGGTSSPIEGTGLTCWSSPAADGSPGIVFEDQTELVGLVEPLTGMYAHAAVWGDLQGDGTLDLFVGTFADRDTEDYLYRGASGPSPDRLLTSNAGVFAPSSGIEEMFTRTSGGAVADLDGDGDLDLVASRNFDDDRPDAPATQILRNDGDSFVSVPLGGLPAEFGGRSVGVLDFDADGLDDLIIVEDRFSGGSSVLLRNLGDLNFEDATTAAGLATGAHGLGVAVADLDNDTHRDILIAGSNRLFMANGDGTFREADASALRWQVFDDEDDVAGVSVGDVNRDGLLDVLIGQHYNSTVDDGNLVPVRLYLNRGAGESGDPLFEDVTEASGLVGLPTKAPHVEINDLDNDGWPDLLTTASAEDGSRPAIFRHLGLAGDIPSFAAPEGLGSAQYWVTGPTADVDRDGRLDMILVEWEPSLPSVYLQNESASGNWLEVSVGADHAFGLGWRVDVYEAGRLGETGALLGAREITVTQGYSAGVAPVAHFGLGDVAMVDIALTAPGGAGHEMKGVGANQHVRYPNGC